MLEQVVNVTIVCIAKTKVSRKSKKSLRPIFPKPKINVMLRRNFSFFLYPDACYPMPDQQLFQILNCGTELFSGLTRHECLFDNFRT